MADYPFRTTDKKLAFALAVAGCTFAPLASDGPATNTYTQGFLRQPRFREMVDGLTVDQAAQKLHAKGIPGTVEYCFVRDATLAEALAASDEMVALHEEAKLAKREFGMPTISAKVVMQVMFLAVHSEEEFRKAAFVNRMRQLASTMNSAEKMEQFRTKNGEEADRRKGEGSGKIWSIFGSQELKGGLHV